jgi:hypothetical protein
MKSGFNVVYPHFKPLKIVVRVLLYLTIYAVKSPVKARAIIWMTGIKKSSLTGLDLNL